MVTALDWTLYLRGLMALLVVIGMIFGTGYVLRRFKLGGAAMVTRRAKRLSVAEVLPLDARHRLVLIRRDGAEHLLLLGATSDLVIESSIPGGERRPAGVAASESES